jgi:hypothetical protein
LALYLQEIEFNFSFYITEPVYFKELVTGCNILLQVQLRKTKGEPRLTQKVNDS